MRFAILLLAISLLLISCGKRNIPGAKIKKRSVSYLEKELAKNDFQTHYLTSKVKARLSKSISGVKSLTLNVRVVNDSAVWISVMPAGLPLEAARILIEPDRFQLLDKLNKRHYDKSFDYLNQLLGFEFTFDEFQNLLYGKAIKNDAFDESGIENGSYFLSSQMEKLWLEPSRYLIDSIQIKDPKIGVLDIALESYERIEKQHFPIKRNLYLRAQETFDVFVEFSKLSLHEKPDMPFKVSSKYEKMD